MWKMQMLRLKQVKCPLSGLHCYPFLYECEHIDWKCWHLLKCLHSSNNKVKRIHFKINLFAFHASIANWIKVVFLDFLRPRLRPATQPQAATENQTVPVACTNVFRLRRKMIKSHSNDRVILLFTSNCNWTWLMLVTLRRGHSWLSRQKATLCCNRRPKCLRREKEMRRITDWRRRKETQMTNEEREKYQRAASAIVCVSAGDCQRVRWTQLYIWLSRQ